MNGALVHYAATPKRSDLEPTAGIDSYTVVARPTKSGKVSVFDRMLWEAKRRSLPRKFATDLLKHDRQILEIRTRCAFAWYLYEHGTHLLWPARADGPISDVFKAREAFLAVNECFTGGIWFVCDGTPETFREVTSKQALEFLTPAESED